MNISRSKGLSLLTVFIILALYNVIAFVLPFEKGGMFWTAYGFTMAAIILAAGVGFYALGREGLRSKFYGWPLLSLVWRYLIAQVILGFLEMVLVFIPFQYAFALNATLLGACLIGLIAIDVSTEEINRIDKKIKEKVVYIQSLQADVDGFVDRSSDEATKKILNNLSEAIRYSDPMSSTQLATLENKIMAKIAALSDHIEKSDATSINTLSDEIQQLIKERNQKCKILK